MELLPDAAAQRDFTDAVYATYRADGVGPALRKFTLEAGLAGSPQILETTSQASLPPEIQEALSRMMANLHFFFAHGVKPISRYVPDVAALRATSARVVVGVGETSTGQLANRTAHALAKRLEVAPVTFPGDHTGYRSRPAAFAERLHQVLHNDHK